VGGKHRGRTFTTGSTSFYQRDPSGIGDTGDTSYGSYMSTRRSRPRQQTPAENEAELRAQRREELQDEMRQELQQGMEERVEQLFQAQWDAAMAAMAQGAQR
ncbi:hypothetical protein A2U01_0070973, partial [Trifolium medium]|nr:hypothetical protein [Trifolium medium]